ncbi:hypothetical protein F5890DRAFT_1495541 [Lentinula detonsa]|uniref:RNase III domain-containing protein n=1 Tax=Lentinula detonsa TaxID=2804962 RepID=A0AA38Q6C6_9AGAR|nr:hypothetical protein F5890DRAFT_1495541 [Lentinula detonsa]
MAPSPYSQLQKKLFKLINQADFDFFLPKLSRTTFINDSDERERLEFVGDFYMAAAVGESLCRYLPNGSPHQYTVARSALTSNSTYSAIMHRLGLSDPQNGRKSLGDAFESIIGAKKKENLASLDDWFQTYYVQLIMYIANACRHLPYKGKTARPRPLLASIKLHSYDRGSSVRKKHISLSPKSVKKQGKILQINSSSIRNHCRIIDLTVDNNQADEKPHENTDDDIVQISSEEFNKSPRTKISLHQSKLAPNYSCTTRNIDPRLPSMSTNGLGASTNPIVID